MPEPCWTQVMVTVAPVDAELVADILWGFGPAAIEEQATTSASGRAATILLAGFELPERADDAATAVLTWAQGPVEVRAVLDDGLDGWRPTATTWRAPPFLLVPSWLDAGPPEPDGPAQPDGQRTDGQQVILLDPGRTFGSGSHPTTRLVLRRLAALLGSFPAPPQSLDVLDVGCGSGVLSVAAALLGAGTVTALDIDPAAPAVTAANAERNGVDQVVGASTAPLAEVADTGRTFDVVVANLLAPVVVELAEDLQRVLAPSGTLVVSGLLADRWPDATSHLTRLRVRDAAIDEGWAAVTLRQQSPVEHRAAF